MILGALFNSMLAYMSMHHFDEAAKIVGVILSRGFWKDPELFFRKAQIVCFDKSSSIDKLREALQLVESECLNETVLAGKKWEPAIKRYRALKEKIQETIRSRVEENFKIAKMILKCAGRLIKGGKGIF